MNIYNLFIFTLGFIDSATPVMEGIVKFHNYIFIYLTFIFFFVFTIFVNILTEFYYITNYPESTSQLYIRKYSGDLNKITHGTALEIFWTTMPSFILVAIALPSFGLLYGMEEVTDPTITFKVIGHQWYWSYEYSDSLPFFNAEDVIFDVETKTLSPGLTLKPVSINFDSNMVPEEELQLGEFRLLQVDNFIVLPTNVHIRALITSDDVLHSWAIPSFGVKVDAVPGRLNQTSIFIKRPGTYYGQCSELCGVNHGFMPIVVKAVDFEDYLNWLSTKI